LAEGNPVRRIEAVDDVMAGLEALCDVDPRLRDVRAVAGEVPLRRVEPGDRAAGRGWYGLVENEAYDVTGISRAPAAPPWVLVILMLGLALLAWRRESR
jgi:hypothetical protein